MVFGAQVANLHILNLKNAKGSSTADFRGCDVGATENV